MWVNHLNMVILFHTLTPIRGLPLWLSRERILLPMKGEAGSIPGPGRSPGGRHGNPLQYSCLENPMDRGAWWATTKGLQTAGYN